ncbi:nuclear transport factor 2 family protein [Nocardia sp. NPDC046473]|uniref:nuclear transport factor 2 family protein n=1 Tax=Nocardia sp. NPDC046473 TaxID=3155733 RepID=UPI0033FE956C
MHDGRGHGPSRGPIRIGAFMQATTSEITFERLYAEVQQFYAKHLQLLDMAEAQEWAETFTEDATFSAPTLAAPVRGRTELAAGLRRTAAELAAAGEKHRHWHGMINVECDADGTIVVHCYAMVIATKHGGESRFYRICVCHDRLVRLNGELQVRSRVVTRDDLA